ncbi:sulfatase-like hydrolase/transferase [Candidatus Poribacteria bacterium]|nr:sulfatase-like hydrolase/transferase [Candidatus Poribacteria bacterium]
MKKPNVVFVFGDQWRAHAAGYAGNQQIKTPNLDSLSGESVNFVNAVSGCPVCSPYRASLMTGQFPLTHGVFVNDVYLSHNAVSIADAYAGEGYDTAYIGKWHLDGHGRSNYIPPERRQGFDYWKVLECTHDYNNSPYYSGNSDEKLYWEEYDAIAQTRDAQDYITNHNDSKPFLLMLSWGPPHNPYQTAPEEYKAMYDSDKIELRPNVTESMAEKARQDIAGYYAHCSALDACIGDLLDTIGSKGIEENTIFIFTSDHGDMLGSQGHQRKQRPWDESIRVPFLLRYPAMFGNEPKELNALIDAPDIMPTLLGLCGMSIPDTVEGLDYSGYMQDGENPSDGACIIGCPHPFGEWARQPQGGIEYRGIRTLRYTYVRTIEGPWLLYDNQKDPYQLKNLINKPEYSSLQAKFEAWLKKKLDDRGDEFLTGMEYIRKWGYKVNKNGTVPYTN